MGFLGRRKGWVPPHPRQQPTLDIPLTEEAIRQAFSGCADFQERTLELSGGEKLWLCWIGGMTRTERLNDYIIRPLTETEAASADELLTRFLWVQTAEPAESADDVAYAIIEGSCGIFLPDGRAVTAPVPTEEKRSISPPENETEVKGARDAFVESIRTNTSLLRRRLRTPFLRISAHKAGRSSVTPVEVLWVDGLTDPNLVAQVEGRVADLDIDAMLTTGNLEEYLVTGTSTLFPQAMFTERPDRFCSGLMDGRVGIFIDGIPLGCLLPGDIAQFLKTPQDKSYHWMIASILMVMRWLCLLGTLLLPGFYIAVAAFHFEMIPTRLAQSIIVSRQDVPFAVGFEVLVLLIAFEILQEAGLRLPKTIGQTVSIIGGLVVGQAAVDAKIVSPVVVIVVSAAGIAGFTMPNQDFSNALRVWRFLMAAAAALGGLFGLTAVGVALVYHLARLEHFGVAYLTPFAAAPGVQVEGHTLIREPLPRVKLRELALHPRNKRKQR